MAREIPVAWRYNLKSDLQRVYDVVLDLWQEGNDSVYSATDICHRCEVDYGYTPEHTQDMLDNLVLREVLRMEKRNFFDDPEFGPGCYEPFFGPHSFQVGTP